MFFACDYDYKLAARLCLIKMGYNLGQCAPDALLVNLGNLTASADHPVFAEILNKLLKSFQHSVGRFIKYHSARFFTQTFEPRCPSFLLWQKSFEAETVARQTRRHQSRHKGRGPGKTLHCYSGIDSLSDQEKPWITYAGSACIAYQSHRSSGSESIHYRRRCAMLVKLVVGKELVLYFKMLEQYARRAGVF